MNSEVSNDITCFWCEQTGYGDSIINDIPFCWQSNIVPFNLCGKILKKINTIEENYECPICFENKKSMELPSCNHKLCLDCYKIIYCGVSHLKKVTINDLSLPKWPYLEYDEDGDIIEDEKEGEHYDYIQEKLNFQYEDEERSYDVLIEIRNSLIETRPEWMNVEEIINYENELFRVCIEHNLKVNEYAEKLTIGNQTCPLCRSEIEY